MRLRIEFLCIAGALLVPGLCQAQARPDAALRGPSLGLLVEPASHAIRPILGIPGAAVLGTPLNVGFNVQQAVVAPGGDFALAVSHDTLKLARVRSDGSPAQWLQTAAETPGLIAFSPRGLAAAIYYPGSGHVAVLSALRSQTPQSATLEPASLPSAPTALAVSEDGKSLLLATAESTSTALYYLPVSGSGAARRLGTFASAAALRFAGTGNDALVADRTADTVYLIQDVPGNAQIAALGTAQDGLSQPEALDAMDARRVLVLNGGAHNLTMLFRDGSPAQSVQCNCTPNALQQMPGNSVYRLTEAAHQPLWILDGSKEEGRFLAVPPDPPQSRPTRARKGAQQ